MKVKKPKYKFAHVMLIDDSDLDNFINEKTIEANNFAEKVYVHTSAKSALEFLSNLERMGPAFTEAYPSVIFIDINMPMIDGFQFIEQYRKGPGKQHQATRLVILTSSVNKEDRAKAGSLSGDIVFYNKPLTRQMLEDL